MSAIIKWLNLQAGSPEYMPASEREMFCDTIAEIRRLERIEKAARADSVDWEHWYDKLVEVLKNNPRSRRKLKDA